MVTLQFDLRPVDCESLNGLVKVDSDYQLDGNLVRYDSLLSGSLTGNGCKITFEDLNVLVETEASLNIQSTTLTGTVEGSCLDGSFICDFDNTSLSSLEEACILN